MPIFSHSSWDFDHVAKTIDTYWIHSPHEIDHRKKIGKLIGQWILPHERFLEMGCGSGLIYEQLVPHVLPNRSYVGIDDSHNMLDIAKTRFPEGHFLMENLYDLSFEDRSFDTVAAFEVLGHLADIKMAIQQMHRVAKRQIIFTLWIADTTKIEQEPIEDSIFIKKIFSMNDALHLISDALSHELYEIQMKPLSENVTAFIIQKKCHH